MRPIVVIALPDEANLVAELLLTIAKHYPDAVIGEPTPEMAAALGVEQVAVIAERPAARPEPLWDKPYPPDPLLDDEEAFT